MNGVAGSRQPLWLELGATNRASQDADGSNVLAPAVRPGMLAAKIIASAPPTEDAQGNLLSWSAVQTRVRGAIAAHAAEVDGNVAFSDIVQGSVLAGFPRTSNTYLCNNVTYVTGWLMSHPGRQLRLLRASQTVADTTNEVRVGISSNLAAVPRVFVHWPSDLADKHHAAAANVLKAVIGAQLEASRGGDAPSLGDTTLADPSVSADAPTL